MEPQVMQVAMTAAAARAPRQSAAAAVAAVAAPLSVVAAVAAATLVGSQAPRLFPSPHLALRHSGLPSHQQRVPTVRYQMNEDANSRS